MHGTIGKDGTVTITFNLCAGERLTTLWTDKTTGRPRNSQYIPCEACGKVVRADLNVVSALCDECERRQARLARCAATPTREE